MITRLAWSQQSQSQRPLLSAGPTTVVLPTAPAASNPGPVAPQSYQAEQESRQEQTTEPAGYEQEPAKSGVALKLAERDNPHRAMSQHQK